MRILVVDDNELVASAIANALYEHEIIVTVGGPAALEHLARDARFDCVLCDVLMPDKNGIDIHNHLLTSAPHLAMRMLFMTGGLTSSVSRAIDRTNQPCIEKPFTRDELLRALVRTTVARAGDVARLESTRAVS